MVLRSAVNPVTISDLTLFAKLHHVQDKASKKLIPFDPLPMQAKIFKAVEFAHQALEIFETLEEDREEEHQQVRNYAEELDKEKLKKEELIKKLKLGDL